MKFRLFFTLSLIQTTLIGFAQQNELKISGNYDHVSFSDFVENVEQQIPVRFLYHQKMVDSLYISGSYDERPVNDVLSIIFQEWDLNFLIIDKNKIILTEKIKIQTQLPVNYFARTETGTSTPGYLVFGFEQETEEKARLINTLENTVLEIGKNSGTSTTKNASIAGYIKDKTTGEPIIGALIYKENPPVGVASDQFGYYSITIPKGNHELKIKSMGYKDTKRQVTLYNDGTLDIEMDEDIIPLKEVIIESESDVNISGMQLGLDRLDIQALKKVPPVLGEVDVLRIALTLPGVQTVGEAANGFHVRGGSADQNLVLFYDAPIYNPTHLFGFFSSFNPDAIKNVNLYKGSIPAQFGGRISSVLEVQDREGNNKKFVGSGGISPVTARLTLEGPVIQDKASYIAGFRSSYSDWILKKLPNASLKNSSASFYDVFGKLSFELNDNNTIYTGGYFSKDRFSFNSDTLYGYSNAGVSLQWKHIFNNRLYSVFSGIYSGYSYNINSEKNEVNAFNLDYSLSNYIAKIDFSYFPKNQHKIDFGINSMIYGIEPGSLTPRGENSFIIPNILEKEQGVESVVYFGDIYDISPDFSLYLGLRYSLFNYLGPKSINIYAENEPLEEENVIGIKKYKERENIQTYHGPEFRFSARFDLSDESSLKLGFDRMRQYIHMLSNTTSISPTDIWVLSNNYVKPQIGDQISIGFFRNFKNNSFESSVEMYYKRINNLLDFKNGALLLLNENIETEILSGTGRSYGIEFLLKKKTGKWNGWMSYTYSRALIKVGSEAAFTGGESINNGEYYPTSYDKPHNVNLLSNYKFTRRISFSGYLTYSTGRPITYPVAKYYYGNSARLHYSDRNQFRIPDYFRLDLSINLEGNHKIQKLNHSSWTFSVYNITGRNNVYSIYFVSEDGKVNGYKLSVFANAIPTITYNFRF
jgi:hypothetical protein